MPRTCVILYLVLWANFIFYLIGTFVEAFQCMPVQKAWYPLWSGHCINQKAAETSSAAINTFSDFVILVVPIANVWGLQLYKKGRVGLLTIFSFGILYVQLSAIIPFRPPYADTHLIFDSACIASIVRLLKFAQNQPTVEGAVDVTWNDYPLGLIRYVALQRITQFLLSQTMHRTMKRP